jgi:hypothetical protein
MGNWIPTQELTEVELHDIKLLKEGREKRGNEGVFKMLLLTEQKVTKMLRESKDPVQLHWAQGIAQFLDELSELINLEQTGG